MNVRERAFLPSYVSGFGFLSGQKWKNINYLNVEDIDFEILLSMKLEKEVEIKVSGIFMCHKSFYKS